MKSESQDWLDWLHDMRREEEERRVREGTSLCEWLRQVNAEADAIMAQLTDQGQPAVARDKAADPKGRES
jgi:hypothetical protein